MGVDAQIPDSRFQIPGPTGERLFGSEIAEQRGISERAVHKRLRPILESLNGTRKLYVEEVRVRGGARLKYDLALVEAAWPPADCRFKIPDSSEVKIEDLKLEISEKVEVGDHAPDGPPADRAESSSPLTTSEIHDPSPEPSLPVQSKDNVAALQLESGQSLLPFSRWVDEKIKSLIPEPKRPLTFARAAAIEPLVSGEWKKWIGQRVHGVEITNLGSFVKALAKDSEFEIGDLKFQSVLLDWQRINFDLQIAANDPRATITPVSERTFWRWHVWNKKGRKADGVTLEPGLPSLQELDRKDKGTIRLLPIHAEYLTSLFLGGDPSVKKVKLANERPRSAPECLELIKLEIMNGSLPAPAPSLYLAQRWLREALPRIVKDYARVGQKRALARRGPYIPRTWKNTQVNDCWMCDFRRTNVMTWLDLGGRLYRVFLCGILDCASRDITICFDLYPSAQLFKSTLRQALLKWGVPREIWMDNGKEFTCEEILEGQVHETREKFQVDEEAKSIFAHLGCDPHYCIKENPTGKALLERFFQSLDRPERKLPGWTGEDHKKRPERLKYEERVFRAAAKGEAPDPLLWPADQLADYETRYLESAYRHHEHSGLRGMTPAQIQAAFDGVRHMPRREELDILLWHRKRVTARGDKVSFQYRNHTFTFRSEMLLTLPGDCEVELHVDPLNADRAVAIDLRGRTIPLEPVNPEARSTADVKFENHRKRSLEKAIRRAAIVGSSLAPVKTPMQYLEMYERDASRKNEILRSAQNDTTEEFSMPVYAGAAEAMKESRPALPPAKAVQTIDPRDLEEIEAMFGGGNAD